MLEGDVEVIVKPLLCDTSVKNPSSPRANVTRVAKLEVGFEDV
jgi:hypothetical protein